ncbi:hypothetical protein HBH45_030630 [Parastagonospora nodorum]|nr:hypothetical protein HBH54_010330 [Parastagonospora nodorum]KAH4144270.1 hypothetical protein HBH45_030630 [Parastagonospora nodorum]KAH4561989.1 hypothetical protein HBH84_181350 [Parastagonospora nodorum]KAH4627489.1 hypothetical protein HBH81_177930 [Parastagonospora nodorum]KAH5346450.1 hypothetical protein HBI48_194310 [Parastagonospora nodorum]
MLTRLCGFLITPRRRIDCAMKNIQWLRRLEADTRLYDAASMYWTIRRWLSGMPNHMLDGGLSRAISRFAGLIYVLPTHFFPPPSANTYNNYLAFLL